MRVDASAVKHFTFDFFMLTLNFIFGGVIFKKSERYQITVTKKQNLTFPSLIVFSEKKIA